MSEKEFDVTVVGSIFMDLICYAERLPKPGETIDGTDFLQGFGGKGANQCVASQRLGAKTAFVGKLGRDSNGKQYYDNFVSEGVNVDCVHFEENIATGVASILVGNDSGDNVIVLARGATKLVTPEYVEQVGEQLISRSKVVVCQLEISTDSTLTALRLAKKHGATTIFNAAPGLSGLPREIFHLTDILCVNESEAELVSGVPTITSVDEAKVAIEKMRQCNGCQTVIITLGSGGALLWDDKTNAYYHIEAPKVKAVDTTGAGDCFIGTLAYCVSQNEDLQVAMRKSILNATDSVLKKGTQSSFPRAMVQS